MHAILASASQAWPPFVLVAGLLCIGSVAADDGLFESLGARLARMRLGGLGLLLALLALVAVASAVLNLDTAVVFLTPVLVHAARARGLDERSFLYGSVFMANTGSLLLPGSNLTNLLVLRASPESGGAFALRMLPAWAVACALTACVLALTFRLGHGAVATTAAAPLSLGVGAAAALAAAVLVVALPDPALPVLGVGLAAAVLRRLRPEMSVRLLGIVFGVAVFAGTLARIERGLIPATGTWATAALGAVSSVVVNNLPAAVVLSAHASAHPVALLFGLDLGPNLAVTGSLSALLWLRAARAVGAKVSVWTYSRIGAVLVPLTLAASVAATR